MPAERILIVDDDRDVRESMGEYLSGHGYEVTLAEDGEALRRALAAAPADVVLLDLNMPGEDGLSLARWLRAEHDVAIIMVTAAGEVVDRVVGLEVGADDYLAKPFDPRELRARLKSVLRRAKGRGAPATRRVKVGRCSLDLQTHQLFDAGGEELPLTGMEFDLLRVFAERPNAQPRVGAVRPFDRHPHRAPAQEDRGQPGKAEGAEDGARGRLHLHSRRRLGSCNRRISMVAAR
jgi:two-component system phosphate regulon response regulator OmpR